MQVTRSLIDIQHCPAEVIQRHLEGRGPSYWMYHYNAYQIQVTDSGNMDDIIGLIDQFIDVYGEAIKGLNYDESSDNPHEPLRMTLQIAVRRDAPPKDVRIPARLLANLTRTGLLLEFLPAS